MMAYLAAFFKWVCTPGPNGRTELFRIERKISWPDASLNPCKICGTFRKDHPSRNRVENQHGFTEGGNDDA